MNERNAKAVKTTVGCHCRVSMNKTLQAREPITTHTTQTLLDCLSRVPVQREAVLVPSSYVSFVFLPKHNREQVLLKKQLSWQVAEARKLQIPHWLAFQLA